MINIPFTPIILEERGIPRIFVNTQVRDCDTGMDTAFSGVMYYFSMGEIVHFLVMSTHILGKLHLHFGEIASFFPNGERVFFVTRKHLFRTRVLPLLFSNFAKQKNKIVWGIARVIYAWVEMPVLVSISLTRYHGNKTV